MTLISQTFFLNVVWDGVHEYFCCFPMFEYHSVLHEFPSLRRCRRKIVGIYKPGTVISQYSILVLHGSYSSKAFIYKIAKWICFILGRLNTRLSTACGSWVIKCVPSSDSYLQYHLEQSLSSELKYTSFPETILMYKYNIILSLSQQVYQTALEIMFLRLVFLINSNVCFFFPMCQSVKIFSIVLSLLIVFFFQFSSRYLFSLTSILLWYAK